MSSVVFPKMSFPSVKLNLPQIKPFPSPLLTVSQIRFKLRSQLEQISQMRSLITLTTESSIISIGTHIAYNITRKALENIPHENSKTKNGYLRNTSINRAVLRRLNFQDHPNPSGTEKWKCKSESEAGNLIILNFLRRTNIPDFFQKTLICNVVQLEYHVAC